MELKIDSENQNKLLGRKEVEATVSFTGPTPDRNSIKDVICGKVAANRDLAVIREIKGHFGQKKIKVIVHVYENAERLKKVEPGYLLKRGMPKETKQEEQKPQQKKGEK